MKYRYLNKILLDWGNSEEDLQDNNIIKSSDIKKEIEQCFIYRVDDEPSRIRIFNVYGQTSEEYEKYKDKVYINGKHVELIDGVTVDTFNPGEYRVYIEDIDQIINWYIFYNCPQLIKAYIPSSVTSIGSDAFLICTGLTSIDIPNSVTSIGNSAFRGCSNLTSVTIPNSVKSIGDYAFSGCTSLTSIDIPNSVTSIGYEAFSGCSGLTSVNIGNSVTHIDERAFLDCSDLTSITIGNSVTIIGEDAFNNCINIQTVYVEDINKFKQIYFRNRYANPTCYGAKLIEL